MHNSILFSVILIEGFVSIATEIITIRQLLPVVGSSIEVTSYIIGVYLLALAYGYRRGGKYVSNYTAVLQRNFIIASILIGIGLSYNFVQSFFILVPYGSLFLYLTFVTAPLVYLLGQTLPITMNLFTKEYRASEVGSKVLHISTLGSFLGSIVTTVVLMNYVGVNSTIVINCLLLLFASIIVSPHKSLAKQLSYVFLLPFLCVVNLYGLQSYVLHSNAYNTYQIIDPFVNSDSSTGKMLVLNNSGSSYLANTTRTGSEYIETIKKIIFSDLKARNQNILVLGAGGFSMSAAGEYDNNFTYVDIDPDLYNVSQKFFLDKINGDFIAQDARAFLLKNKTKFPIIVADTYGHSTSIPAHLLTMEYFDLLAKSLTPDGVVIINTIINPYLLDKYSKSVDSTIRKSFANCMSIPREYVNQAKNVIYVCNNHYLSNKNSMVYSDDINRSSLDKVAINSGTASNKSATKP